MWGPLPPRSQPARAQRWAREDVAFDPRFAESENVKPGIQGATDSIGKKKKIHKSVDSPGLGTEEGGKHTRVGTGGPWACGEPCPGASAGECQHFHQQKLSRRPPAEAPRGCWCDTSRLGVVASVPRGAGPTGQRRSHGLRWHRRARRRRLGQHVPSKENPRGRQRLARALSGLRADLQSQLRGLKCARTHVHTPLRGQRCAHTHTYTHRRDMHTRTHLEWVWSPLIHSHTPYTSFLQ